MSSHATVAGGSVAAGGGSTFAALFDFFSYKRVGAGGGTSGQPPSPLWAAASTRTGAACSLFAAFIGVLLLVSELLAYMTPVVQRDVVLAPPVVDGGGAMRLALNFTFPRMPCHLLTLSTTDALGMHAQAANMSGMYMLPINAAAGRSMLRAAVRSGQRMLYGEPVDAADESFASFYATGENFASFIKSVDVAFVSFGAPWCPWSRKLSPIWEEVARIVQAVPNVKLARVDCTDAASRHLCRFHHVNAYPTILLFKDGAQHSHTMYEGHRTTQDLLNFLVIAQQDETLHTDASKHEGAKGHELTHDILRQLRTDLNGSDAQEAFHGRDPAEPGRALALIERMHAAGFKAPGDAARSLLHRLLPSEEAAAASHGGSGEAASPTPVPPAQLLAEMNEGSEGCQVAGVMTVPRVGGALSVRPFLHGLSLPLEALNMTHIVHELYFGRRLTDYQLSRLPQGTQQELHRLNGALRVSATANASHAHVMHIVHSAFSFATGHAVTTFRYTADSFTYETAVPALNPTTDALPEASLPAVHLKFEQSPMAVLVRETRPPLYSFVTSLFAIIGGVFTIVSLMDSALHSTLHHLRYKRHIGKSG